MGDYVPRVRVKATIYIVLGCGQNECLIMEDKELFVFSVASIIICAGLNLYRDQNHFWSNSCVQFGSHHITRSIFQILWLIACFPRTDRVYDFCYESNFALNLREVENYVTISLAPRKWLYSWLCDTMLQIKSIFA